MASVLGYVNFDAEVLRARLSHQLEASGLPEAQRSAFLDDLHAGLKSYTYLG